MVLCNRCKLETMDVHWKGRPCVKRDGGPCLVSQEDMELERKIQELQDRRRNLHTRMNASHDPFILTFPPEISSHIFLLSLQEWDYDPVYGDKYWCNGITKGLPTPFLLSSICRGWRQLARSTPMLWTTLTFTLAKPAKGPLVETVRDWLLLSGGLPLDICVSSYEGEDPASEEMYSPVIDALNQHSGRWRELYLRIPAPYVRHFHGSFPPNSLYRLDVSNCTSRREFDGPLPTFRMNFKPSPTDLTMRKIRFSVNDIGWSNLTSLSMESMTFNECIMAIRHAPLLESCTMEEIDSDQGDVAIAKTKIRHMHLRTLDIHFMREDLSIEFLGLMELPVLEAFCYEPMDIAMVDCLFSFLSRSENRLKELALYGNLGEEFPVEGLKKLLDATPFLQCLEFYGFREGVSALDEVLQELSSSAPILAGGTPGFLPHLQSFTFSNCYVSKWEYIPSIYTWPHRKLLRMDLPLT
ncbi:hypothetical protein M413DRAFT_246604 [Hebeloma cylindrosporum]|uniref:F-box domain-containing protein n=1 Tax=Hebeloma cylindrosporum TaxID=76867 RepID=A0A0C2YAV0_HEBCY|nr:hypothetical protein M413DRAFT_246604 [Hebeloma cylindrosporum h7]